MDFKDDAIWASACEAVPHAALWIYKAHGAYMISSDCVPKHSLLVTKSCHFLKFCVLLLVF